MFTEQVELDEHCQVDEVPASNSKEEIKEEETWEEDSMQVDEESNVPERRQVVGKAEQPRPDASHIQSPPTSAVKEEKKTTSSK